MDTLVLTVSMMMIPIQLAARRAEYAIMNHIILLLCSSWSYHSICHEYKHLSKSVYYYLDKIFCYSLSTHVLYRFSQKLSNVYHDEPLQWIEMKSPRTIALGLKEDAFITSVISLTSFTKIDHIQVGRVVGISCLFTMSSTGVALLYYLGVRKNREFDKRGLKNWKYHIPHVMMHVLATLTISLVLLF